MRYRKFFAAGFGCLGLLTGTLNCFAGETAPLKLPDNEIESVMIDGRAIKPQRSKLGNFHTLRDAFESVTLAEESEAIERGDFYIVMTLEYEDESKDFFYFFQAEPNEDAWYVENEEGAVYQGADFIKDYVNVIHVNLGDAAPDGVESYIRIPDPDKLKEAIELNLWLKENEIPYSINDLRALFAAEIQRLKDSYDTPEAAIKAARSSLTFTMAGYQYALKNGCKAGEEELQQFMKKQIDMRKTADGFEELEAFYREYGTSYEEDLEYSKESMRLDYTIEGKLRDIVRDDFRHGNNQVGENVCKTFHEYWGYFYLDVILPSEEEYIRETVEPLLDEAEKFYRENLLMPENKKANTSQEFEKQFLNEFFTTDFEKRYSDFLENEDIDNIDKYYETFSDCATQNCIDKLTRNREPLKHDRLALKEGSSVNVSDINVEIDEEGYGDFEVFLESTKNGKTIRQKASGQIKVETETASGKVDSFFLSSIVELKDVVNE